MTKTVTLCLSTKGNLPEIGKTHSVITHVEDSVVLSDEDISQNPKARTDSIAEAMLKTGAATILLSL